MRLDGPNSVRDPDINMQNPSIRRGMSSQILGRSLMLFIEWLRGDTNPAESDPGRGSIVELFKVTECFGSWPVVDARVNGSKWSTSRSLINGQWTSRYRSLLTCDNDDICLAVYTMISVNEVMS
jgi:hypothetical protein